MTSQAIVLIDRDHIKLVDKQCNTCGKSHEFIPADARPQKDFINDKIVGWFFECSCLSTMFIKIKE